MHLFLLVRKLLYVPVDSSSFSLNHETFFETLAVKMTFGMKFQLDSTNAHNQLRTGFGLPLENSLQRLGYHLTFESRLKQV